MTTSERDWLRTSETVLLTLQGPHGRYLHEFPVAQLPSNWVTRGRMLMNWWRSGYLTLRQAWRLM